MEQEPEVRTRADSDMHMWDLAEPDRWITFPWSDRPPVTGRGVVDA